jgi:hypothetical protein
MGEHFEPIGWLAVVLAALLENAGDYTPAGWRV